MKLGLILLSGILVIAVCAMGIFQYLRPKLILTSALPKLFSQLEERFQEDPLLILADAYDREGKYTADIVMRIDQEITGPTTYEITAQTDAKAHRFLAGGRIQNSEKSIDASLYLDEIFAAVSSEDLVKGNYYGITYNTFASDIRSLPVLSPFVSDQVLSKWTASVECLQGAMGREYPNITVPDFSEQDLKTLLLGITALPCTRETVSASVNGETLSCQKLNYFFDGQQLETILSPATGETYPVDTTVSASFYLSGPSIIRFLIQFQQGDTSHFYNITLGKDPLNDPLAIQGTVRQGNTAQTWSVCIDSVQKGNRLEQTIHYESDQSDPVEYAYEWERATGTMYLKTNAISTPAKLRLSRDSAGLQIETGDFGKFLEILTGAPEIAAAFNDAKCTLVVQSGSNITTPTYKNLDAWSFDDILILMGGLGSLIGFPSAQ